MKAKHAVAIVRAAWVADSRARELHARAATDALNDTDADELDAAHVQRTFFQPGVEQMPLEQGFLGIGFGLGPAAKSACLPRSVRLEARRQHQ